MEPHDENSPQEYVGHAERSKQQKQFENQFDEDLSHLAGWGKGLKCWLDADLPPNKLLGMVFRPDRLAIDAMMRLSVQYPHIIKQIDGMVDRANKFLEILAEGDHRAVSLSDAMWALHHRIQTSVEVMRSTKPATSSGQPYLPTRDTREYRLIQVLLEKRAFDRSSLLTTEKICELADGRAADANSYKKTVATLARKGVLETKSGRHGGCWLSSQGRDTADQIFPNHQ